MEVLDRKLGQRSSISGKFDGLSLIIVGLFGYVLTHRNDSGVVWIKNTSI